MTPTVSSAGDEDGRRSAPGDVTAAEGSTSDQDSVTSAFYVNWPSDSDESDEA